MPSNYNIYTIGEYGRVPFDQEAIKNEIYANGPVACSINANPIVNLTKNYGVFGSDDPADHDHTISIVGWGEEDDSTPYWILRNSWGEYWADEGFAKIFRGNNTIRIEEYCIYAKPLDTWSGQIYPHTKRIENLPKWNP